jgi:hypothetical protein
MHGTGTLRPCQPGRMRKPLELPTLLLVVQKKLSMGKIPQEEGERDEPV